MNSYVIPNSLCYYASDILLSCYTIIIDSFQAFSSTYGRYDVNFNWTI